MKDMISLFNALVKKKKDSKGAWHFDCPIGLWGVSSCDKNKAEREAMVYFWQYHDDGEYDELKSRYVIE